MRPIGPEIRRLRKRAGLTQKQAGERAGVAHTLISEVELGNITPSLQSLEAIVQACGGVLRLDLDADPEIVEAERILTALDEPRRRLLLRVLRLAESVPASTVGAVAVFLQELAPAVDTHRIGGESA
jgi:transcriptional regulator with XRE-family HTH domain